jgi:hypothetical protein
LGVGEFPTIEYFGLEEGLREDGLQVEGLDDLRLFVLPRGLRVIIVGRFVGALLGLRIGHADGLRDGEEVERLKLGINEF